MNGMNDNSQFDRKLILENGAVFYGKGFGCTDDRVVEIVFNTSPVGYQEILSDPSYTDQGVVMAYPLIGNYGMAEDDYECETPTIGALIVREYNGEPSNFRSKEPLEDVMKRYGIVGVSEIDTRRLIRHIRDYGSCKALITSANTPAEVVEKAIKEASLPHDAVSRVSRNRFQKYDSTEHLYHVVAIDCGMKMNIVRSLTQRGCDVMVVPWDASVRDILSLDPDGIFLSNGPGDPEDVPEVIDTVSENVQAEIRSSRRQSSRQKSADKQDRDHLTKSFLRGRRGKPEKNAAHRDAYQSSGQHGRRRRVRERRRLRRAVSSRIRSGAAGQLLSV